MKKLISNNWLLITVILVAGVLRLWNLSNIPPHLTPDEASLGYNAFSILNTGRDEYGELLPMIFKSFGDYKPGLYIYLTVPFVAILGLTEFAVRLPSAIAGIVAVYLTYLVVNNLFKAKFDKYLGLIAALMLAISPWHIHFSRGAWEVNVALTLTLAGIYFFQRALKVNKYLILSAIFFALSYLTYQGAKLATTIPIVLLGVIYFRELFKFDRKILVGSVLIGLMICIPILNSALTGKTGRLEVFSVLSYKRPSNELDIFLGQGDERVGELNYYSNHTEALNFARGILGRFFNHFSGRFLFFEGDWQNPRHSAPNHGMLLLSDLILIFVGLVSLIRKKGKEKLFVLSWLIFATLPAILTRDQVHAVRALYMVIPLTIVSAFGLYSILCWIRGFRISYLRIISYIVVLAIFAGSIVYFLEAYFVHMPVHNAKYWFYGYKQAVQELEPIQANYEKIVFQQSYDQPYIYFLFHQQVDPSAYQKGSNLVGGGIDVGLVEELGNVKFEPYSWPKTDKPGTLVVGNSISIPDDFSTEDFKVISEIKYPGDIFTAFRILEVK